MDISSVIFVGIYSINWFYYKSIHYRLQLRSFRRQHIRDFSSFMVKNKHLFDQFKGALEITLTVCLRTKYLNNDLFIAWNNAIRTFKNNEFFGIFWNNIRSPFKKNISCVLPARVLLQIQFLLPPIWWRGHAYANYWRRSLPPRAGFYHGIQLHPPAHIPTRGSRIIYF